MTNILTPTRPARTVTVGVEVDQDTVTYAIARGGAVADVDQIEGATLASAMTRFGTADHIVVAWGAASGTITIGSATDSAGSSIGGRLRCTRIRPGSQEVVVGTADRDEVIQMWPPGADACIVLAPMVLSTTGVWLGIRRSGAELTLVDDGGIRRSRALTCGGLGVLAASLASYGGDGWRHLREILTDPDPTPDRVATVDGRTAVIAREVKSTLASWRKTSRVDPTAVRVYGPGSALPTLEAQLAGEGITALAPPPCPGAPRLDAAARAEAWLAIEAALANPDELVGLPDIRGDARRDAIRRAAHHTRRLVVLGAVGAAASAGVLAPLAHGRVVHHLAGSRLASARRTITRLAPQEAAYRYVKTASQTWQANAAPEPDWGRLVDAVFKTAPPPVAVETIEADATSEPGTVSVLVRAQGGPRAFADLEAWAVALAGNPAVGRVFAPSAESDVGPGHPATKTTFELQFTVLDRAVQTARPFPGGQL